MRHALFFAVALCAGCFGCPTDSEEVDDDFALTEGQVAELEAATERSRQDLSCDHACDEAYRDETGWMGMGVDSCSISIDAEPGADADAVVGSVHCEGTGYEFYCE